MLIKIRIPCRVLILILLFSRTVDVNPAWVGKEGSLWFYSPTMPQATQLLHLHLCLVDISKAHEERRALISGNRVAFDSGREEVHLGHESNELILCHVLLPACGEYPSLVVVDQKIKVRMRDEERPTARPQERCTEQSAIRCSLRHRQLLDLRHTVICRLLCRADHIASVALSAPSLEAENDILCSNFHTAKVFEDVNNVSAPIVGWHLCDGDGPQKVLRLCKTTKVVTQSD
mmetsp:Transcript_28203/g.65201  ORF Transcript_28203/g.65201 Transcript_28203/m.65201 type:complete len:232 (+) Transcript_28203:69-764(+)